MRYASLCFVATGLLLAGCPKDSNSGNKPANPTSSTTSSVGGEIESTTLKLGSSNPVTSGKSYRVADVSVTIQRISMPIGRDSNGREVETIDIELSVEKPGAKAVDLDLMGDTPGEAFGLVFKADALGFQWGASPTSAHLRVDRK